MTAHVIKRCKERNIDSDSIIKVIMQGEIIKQYEDDKPFPSCLILGAAIDGEHIHVVVSHDSDWIYLITAYRPDPGVWEPGFKTRKER